MVNYVKMFLLQIFYCFQFMYISIVILQCMYLSVEFMCIRFTYSYFVSRFCFLGYFLFNRLHFMFEVLLPYPPVYWKKFKSSVWSRIYVYTNIILLINKSL